MSSEIGTWQKAKDVLLVGAAGLVVLGLAANLQSQAETRKEVVEVKLALAVYQANQQALKADFDRLRTDVSRHLERGK